MNFNEDKRQCLGQWIYIYIKKNKTNVGILCFLCCYWANTLKTRVGVTRLMAFCPLHCTYELYRTEQLLYGCEAVNAGVFIHIRHYLQSWDPLWLEFTPAKLGPFDGGISPCRGKKQHRLKHMGVVFLSHTHIQKHMSAWHIHTYKSASPISVHFCPRY